MYDCHSFLPFMQLLHLAAKTTTSTFLKLNLIQKVVVRMEPVQYFLICNEIFLKDTTKDGNMLQKGNVIILLWKLESLKSK